MRIGELGRRAGLSAKAIRYYEGIGLLPSPPRDRSGYRDYNDHAVRRLGFVRAAQSIGLSLGEIREVLALSDRGEAPCAHVADLIERHASEIGDRIASLQAMRADLVRLARRANESRQRAAGDGGYCHLIQGHVAGAL